MLLSVPSKVLARVILERLKNAIDKKLRPESCTDHIATLRIIIEQSIEWQSPLYMSFVDFEKAFDSIDRGVIWKLMQHYGIPQKLIAIIRGFYEDATTQVIHNNRLSDPFSVKTGVRQGCLLSPMIFLLVIDWVMKRTVDNKKTGIPWTFSKQQEDLCFADDICLLSNKHQHMQTKVSQLNEEARKTGLKINIKKTEVMKINNKQQLPITLNSETLPEADKFVYLGSVVASNGGAEDDVGARINKARHAFITLRRVWNSSALSKTTKVRIFNTNVKTILLYGSETWKVTNAISNRLQTFINRCLRQILKIRWPQTISNNRLWEETNQTPITETISKRKWSWIGHTCRREADNITRQALEWNPQGRRRVGRPKETWKRSIEREAKRAGYTIKELKRQSQNRVRWWGLVAALCSSRSEED